MIRVLYEGLLCNPPYFIIMGINILIGILVYKFNKKFKN